MYPNDSQPRPWRLTFLALWMITVNLIGLYQLNIFLKADMTRALLQMLYTSGWPLTIVVEFLLAYGFLTAKSKAWHGALYYGMFIIVKISMFLVFNAYYGMHHSFTSAMMGTNFLRLAALIMIYAYLFTPEATSYFRIKKIEKVPLIIKSVVVALTLAFLPYRLLR